MNKNKLLLIVFAVLLAIYFGNKFLGSENERNFKNILVELDTASVSKVVIKGKSNQSDVTFTKENGNWKVSNSAITDNADMNNVRGILASMVSLKPQRLVANSPEKWAQYEVTDSLGARVEYYEGDKKLTDIMVGKFSFNQAARTAATFVRLTDEDEVYTVDGFLSSTFDQEFNNYRDKTFLETVPENLTSLNYTYPGDSSYSLNNIGDQWQVNGLQADSANVQKYINGLRKINQREFIDNYTAPSQPDYSLVLNGDNMTAIEIKGYWKNGELIMNSSLNPGSYFKQGSFKAFEKLFIGSNQLISKED